MHLKIVTISKHTRLTAKTTDNCYLGFVCEFSRHPNLADRMCSFLHMYKFRFITLNMYIVTKFRALFHSVALDINRVSTSTSFWNLIWKAFFPVSIDNIYINFQRKFPVRIFFDCVTSTKYMLTIMKGLV